MLKAATENQKIILELPKVLVKDFKSETSLNIENIEEIYAVFCCPSDLPPEGELATAFKRKWTHKIYFVCLVITYFDTLGQATEF